MKTHRSLCALLCAVGLRVALTAGAATYFVATNGVDTHPGTEALPWRTIQHAARFMDRAAADFRLRHGSPAIDSGTAGDAPADDFAGRARPVNGAYDIGAHEYDARLDEMYGNL